MNDAQKDGKTCLNPCFNGKRRIMRSLFTDAFKWIAS